jgi:hypothetical protein
MQKDWAARNIGTERAEPALAEWFGYARSKQYPLELRPATWVVTGGRGAGKTRLGAEWVNGLVRGLPPFTRRGRQYERIALVGDTLGDVREVMIEGPSGILTISRAPRPRFEASRRRLVWDNGAVALMFSAEDPESLRGPQFDAAWCDELGCPAVDKGPNQPNVFPDPKSAENAIPYFSSAGRSDLAQQRFLEAHVSYWNPADADFDEAQNPLSPVYGGRMVDIDRTYVWAWDARPFPAFPARGDRWTDGSNWHCGHWLNGRLGNPDAGALINAILADHRLPPADVGHADGTLHGYGIADPKSARAALEPIVELFDLAVCEEADGLSFRRRALRIRRRQRFPKSSRMAAIL